ncbi:phosphopentomutase [Conexibacter sp. SYSU D00693]|uniref:phosphopentomutase n=1 Tax=Conexibacter sp. SYSU D00693 TaxID=2812560 RepID=UPI00196B30A7|nr:phosphopentomutase [Conexibacter sp. SYSU D00693]
MSRRAAVVVLDACGIGALPDAEAYGDAGAHTLAHVAARVGGLDLPHLQRLGLGSIDAIPGVAPAEHPVLHGKLHPLGPGKESATGHWELMGAVPRRPLPAYPDGFPEDVVAALEHATGRRFCCNAPANGLHVLEEWGPHHLRTGELILYTSVDSVLQVAGHHHVLGEDELRDVCRAAREVMTGEHAVGRVIARPFIGSPGAFERTAGRKDLAVAPPGPTALEALTHAGVPVHGVGKVPDLFAGRGIGQAHPGATNSVALQSTTELLRGLDHGLVFTNLVETDQVHGHRKDVEGFHGALREIDAAVGVWLDLLGPDDLLVLTADHGCDPDMAHSDHTREHAPLLAVFPGHGGRRHDGPLADVGQSVLHWLTGAPGPDLPGTSFVG